MPLALRFLYDLPLWVLGIWTEFLFLGASLMGARLSRSRILGSLGRDEIDTHNDLVNNFLSAIGVFYGLTVGLVAVAAWENLSEVEGFVMREADSLAQMYQDAKGYPAPHRNRMHAMIGEYIAVVLEEEWPAQRAGLIPHSGQAKVDRLVREAAAFEPDGAGQEIIHNEFFDGMNSVLENRRERLNSIERNIPAAFWAIVWIGSILMIGLTCLFRTASPKLHMVLNGCMGSMVGLLVFLIVALDHPFWGDMGVDPEPFQLVLRMIREEALGP